MIELGNGQTPARKANVPIPIKPAIFEQIEQATSSEKSEQLADIVATDAALTAAILEVINLPLSENQPSEQEISEVTKKFGSNTVKAIASAILLREAIQENACFSLAEFWQYSQHVTLAMNLINHGSEKSLPLPILYSLGLLCDCGMPMLAMTYPDYKAILMISEDQGVNSISQEEAHYHTNHAVLGYSVALDWQLPKEVCHLILDHHDSRFLEHASTHTEQQAFATLKAAQNLVKRSRFYHDTVDWPLLEQDVLHTLGISVKDYSALEQRFVALLS